MNKKTIMIAVIAAVLAGLLFLILKPSMPKPVQLANFCLGPRGAAQAFPESSYNPQSPYAPYLRVPKNYTGGEQKIRVAIFYDITKEAEIMPTVTAILDENPFAIIQLRPLNSQDKAYNAQNDGLARTLCITQAPAFDIEVHATWLKKYDNKITKEYGLFQGDAYNTQRILCEISKLATLSETQQYYGPGCNLPAESSLPQ